MKQCYRRVQLQPGSMMKINCEDEEQNSSEFTADCTIFFECDQTPSDPEVTSEVKQQFNCGNNSTIIAVLGAVVGLLLLLLVTVITILVWTCWLLKKRGGLKYNAEHQMR